MEIRHDDFSKGIKILISRSSIRHRKDPMGEGKHEQTLVVLSSCLFDRQ